MGALSPPTGPNPEVADLSPSSWADVSGAALWDAETRVPSLRLVVTETAYTRSMPLYGCLAAACCRWNYALRYYRDNAWMLGRLALPGPATWIATS